MTRKLAILISVGVLATACGPNLPEPVVPDAYPAPARALDLPDPVEAVPAFIVGVDRPTSSRIVERVRRLPGVAAAAGIQIDDVPLTGPGGREELRVAAIDPIDYRSLAPPVSRDAPFVWSALMAGNAVLTFEAAEKLGAADARSVKMPRWGALKIGAFADNGTPNLADVLVDVRLARELGVRGDLEIVIGAAPDASFADIERALQRVLPNARIEPLVAHDPGEQPEPAGSAQGGLIGTMRFKVLKGGFIEPDPAWVAANITTGDVPILGSVTCHRLLIPQMGAALKDIERQGLAHLIDRSDYGGCYVPRFIARDPKRALSMHAFGLAFDLNVSQNYEGTTGKMDPRVVDIFERWGFDWGGVWSTPDPMHFELARLVR